MGRVGRVGEGEERRGWDRRREDGKGKVREARQEEGGTGREESME
jgi:hypothetical protein